MKARKKYLLGEQDDVFDTLNKEGWLKFLIEFNKKVERKVDVEEFNEQLCDIVVEFGEPILLKTG